MSSIAIANIESIPEADSETVALHGKAQSIVAESMSCKVTDSGSMAVAAEKVSVISKMRKAVEEKRKFLTRPITEAKRRIDEMFKSITEPLDYAERSIKGKISEYQMEQQRLARAAEEKARKEAEEQAKKAVLNGEIALPPVPVFAPAPQKTVRTDTGTVSTTKVWKFDIIDENEIPRCFLMVNETAIRAAVRAGTRQIPGVRIYEDVQVSVR